MTRDDIIRMVAQCGLSLGDPPIDPRLERFAVVIAAAEREECAKVCETRSTYWQRDDIRRVEDECCAAAIRARGAQ